MPEIKKRKIQRCFYCAKVIKKGEGAKYLDHRAVEEHVLVCAQCIQKLEKRECKHPGCDVLLPKRRVFRNDDDYKWPGLEDYCRKHGEEYKQRQEPLPIAYCVACGARFPGEDKFCPECIDKYAYCPKPGCNNLMEKDVKQQRKIIKPDGMVGKAEDLCCRECFNDQLAKCGCGRFFVKNGEEECALCKKLPHKYCFECGKFVVAKNCMKVRGPNKKWVYVCLPCSIAGNAGECTQCGAMAYPRGSKYHRHHDGDYGKCASCIGTPIMGYNYHRPARFFGEGPLFFGFENEYDFPEECAQEFTDQLRQWANKRYKEYHLTHDGSLRDGCELVSRPMSYDVWMNMDEVIPRDIPNYLDLVSKKTGDVGTAACHIHISKAAFKKYHLYKFINFLNDNFDKFLPAFGRGMGHYCADIDGSIPSYIRRGQHNYNRDDKYKWLSLKPEHTVEVRIFRGAQTSQDMKSNIQLLKSVYDYTKTRGSKKLSWAEYYDTLDDYPLVKECLSTRSVEGKVVKLPLNSKARLKKPQVGGKKLPKRAVELREMVHNDGPNPLEQWIINDDIN